GVKSVPAAVSAGVGAAGPASPTPSCWGLRTGGGVQAPAGTSTGSSALLAVSGVGVRLGSRCAGLAGADFAAAGVAIMVSGGFFRGGGGDSAAGAEFPGRRGGGG